MTEEELINYLAIEKVKRYFVSEKEELEKSKKKIQELELKWREEFLKKEALQKILIDEGLERWKSIENFEGLYSVSSLGRVKNDRTGRVLKPVHHYDYSWKYIYYVLYKDKKKIVYYAQNPFYDN